MSTLATKNFILSRTYGASASAAPFGIVYLCSRSHSSRPPDSFADRTKISYSPTANCASILTPWDPSPLARRPS